jgi:hypothetical protein
MRRAARLETSDPHRRFRLRLAMAFPKISPFVRNMSVAAIVSVVGGAALGAVLGGLHRLLTYVIGG